MHQRIYGMSGLRVMLAQQEPRALVTLAQYQPYAVFARHEPSAAHLQAFANGHVDVRG